MPQHPAEQHVISLLQQLIRAPSPPGQEGRAAALLAERLRALDYDAVWQDECGNIIGRRSGEPPGPALLFDAHLDVVPVDMPQQWRHEPFGGEIEAGRVWGRGAADTKGSLAAMVVGLGTLPRSAFRGTLYVSGSLGEEVTEGAALSKVIAAVRPQAVIIGEPSDCRLGIGQKGRAKLVFTVAGRAGHSSAADQSENAIYKMAELLRIIAEMPLPADPQLGSGVLAPLQIISLPQQQLSSSPAECRLSCDLRLVRGESAASVLTAYRDAFGGRPDWQAAIAETRFTTYTGYTFTVQDFYPAWLLPAESPWVDKGMQALAAAGLDAQPITVPFCTNGSYSAGVAGIPTLIFGPSQVQLAHAVDESIAIDELLQGMRGYQELAKHLSQMA